MHASHTLSQHFLVYTLSGIGFCLPILSLFGGTFVIVGAVLLVMGYLWYASLKHLTSHGKNNLFAIDKTLLIGPPSHNRLFLCALTLLFIWCTLSILWSTHHLLSSLSLLKITPIFGMFLFLSTHTSRWLLSKVLTPLSVCFVMGYIVACIILLSSPFLTMGLTLKSKIQGGLFLSVTFWYVLFVLIERLRSSPLGRIFTLISLLLLSFFVLRYSECDTTLVAMGMGLILSAGFINIGQSKILTRTLLCCIMLAFLTTPLICYYGFSPHYHNHFQKIFHDSSYLHRLHLWHETARYIMKKPLLGIGLGTSRTLGTKETFDLSYRDKNGIDRMTKAEKMGIHPHNIALQLWLELGFMGAFLGGLITSLLFYLITNIKNRPQRFTSMGCFITAIIIFWLNVGTFQTWWLSSIIIVIFLFRLSFVFSLKDFSITQKHRLHPKDAEI